MNGNAHSDIFATAIDDVMWVVMKEDEVRRRKSWLWLFMLIIIPAQMNNNDLNKAWVDRWKNVKYGIFIPRVIIITPSCLNVLSAMIFFISVSSKANIPAKVIVVAPIRRIEELKWYDFMNG